MSDDAPRTMDRPWHEAIAIGVFSAAVVALLFFFTPAMTADHPDFAHPADHHKYIHMAEGSSFGFHIAPYCRRVGVPLLVEALPFSAPIAFRLIAVACLWGTGLAVYYLLKAGGHSSPLALAGMLLYAAMGWPTRYLLYDFWLPDAAAFLLVVLAIWCLFTRHDAWFAVILLLGVALKESVIFAAPLYLTLREPVGPRWRFGLRWLGLIAPAVLVLLALRWAIPAWNDDPAYVQSLPVELRSVDAEKVHYDYWARLREIGAWRLDNLSPEMLLAYTAGTFGVPAVVMPLLALRRNVRLLLRFVPFLVLVYAQLFFATDTQRLLILGFPGLLLLALNGFAHVMRAWRTSVTDVIILALIILGLSLASPTRFTASSTAQAGLLAVYLFVCLWRRYRHARRTSARQTP